MFSAQMFFSRFFFILRILLITTLSIVIVNAASGDVDTLFQASISKSPDGRVVQTLIQPDGKIIISGEFFVVNGMEKVSLARLNSDGTLDTTFNPPPIFTAGAGIAIIAIALQSDGKLIIGGQFAEIDGTPRRGIARLNSDGSPDTTFNSNPSLDDISYLQDLVVLPNDQIVINGFRSIGGGTQFVRLLNSDGTLVGGRTLPITQMSVQPDGKLLIAVSSSIKRLNPNLSDDPTFSTISYVGSSISAISTQSDGKIMIGGNFSQINGTNVNNLIRANSNGTIDTSFNTNEDGPNARVNAIVSLSSGQNYIAGTFTAYNQTQTFYVARLNSDGTLDNSFDQTIPFNEIYDMDVQTDGKLLISSLINTGFGYQPILRLDTVGSLDSSLQTSVGEYGIGYRVLVQPDDKILMTGSFSRANTGVANGAARFSADGQTDVTFGIGSEALALQPDNKIILGGNPFTSNPQRFNPDGTLDTTFTALFSVHYDVEVQSDGKILFAGQTGVSRLNSNGTTDNSLNVATDGHVRKVIYLPDTKILIAGNFSQVNGVNRGRIARLFNDGTVDTSFNPPGGANATIYDVAVQSDGKILVGGSFTSINFNGSRKYLARLNSNGSLDTSFTPVLDSTVFTIKIQPDDKILFGGSMSVVNGVSRIRIARIEQNGALDFSFNPGLGANGTVRSIDIQSDGKIIAAGEFTRFNGLPAIGIVRLLNDSSVNTRTAFDFDGDGKSDVSVFRPSENKWYVLRSSDFQLQQTVFAINNDIPTPADFDGDGKIDLAIFRPSTGSWWYLSSVDNVQKSVQFGASGDIPMPSDINGDGVDDFVVFRPSNNVWYRATSNDNTVSSIAFGANGDKPLIGDFDGDGKADPAIFRPSTGDWWYQSSIDNSQRATHWGISTDIPIPADYDGDGKTDLAVYRPSEGGWYIFNSSTGLATTMAFGISTDIPIPADYDGDGKADIAVFRPQTGIWYLLQSTDGFTGLQLGLATDTPIPSVFLQ